MHPVVSGRSLTPHPGRALAALLALALLLGLSAPTALAQSGTVRAWGYNGYGQATVPAGLSGVVQVDAGGFHSLALQDDGTVVAWGRSHYGQATVPAGLSGVTQVAAGFYHNLALKDDSTVVAWGRNAFGESTVPVGLSGVVQVAVGGFHSLAVKDDGTVTTWGSSSGTSMPAGLSGVVQVASGNSHSLALKGDGTVVAWGSNDHGETDVPAGLAGVVQVAGGGFHSLAVKDDGTVVGWGRNTEGQTTVPAGLTDVVQVAAGDLFSLALKRDGTVVGWGYNAFDQTTVPAGLTGVGQIAADGNHGLALVLDYFTTGGPVDGSGNPVPEPVLVFAAGGTVNFEAGIQNNTEDPLATQVWLAVRFPDGTLVTKRNAKLVEIAAGETRPFNGAFDLLPGFPEGAYTLYGYYGTHPGGGTEVFAITIDKVPVDPLKAGAAPSLTPAEIAALDPDAFLSFGDEARATTPGAEVPTSTALGSAYPNPFNPSATVPFTLTEASDVTLAVYDVLGREVAVLVDGRVEAGSHTVRFEAQDLPSGTYLVRFAAGGHTQTQRVTLLK